MGGGIECRPPPLESEPPRQTYVVMHTVYGGLSRHRKHAHRNAVPPFWKRCSVGTLVMMFGGHVCFGFSGYCFVNNREMI